ncbi:hypothetical protein CHCC20490_1784 [Bacillus paralicheniformis]|nr:hypothetical protein CHCC20490_1784 [Bacillus paralicheniformis]
MKNLRCKFAQKYSRPFSEEIRSLFLYHITSPQQNKENK